MIPEHDRRIVRELAKSYRELSELDVNRERIDRIKAVNGLHALRPPLWIDEIPWNEMDMDGRLALRCESSEGRQIEDFFRKVLYRWEFIQADMVVERAFYIAKSYTDTGIGLTVKNDTISSDTENAIVSHRYEDQLDTEEKVDALHPPVITAKPDLDRRNLEEAEEVLDGILPVKLRGHEMFYAPWDDIAQYRGVENCLVDMVENPGLVHRTIKKLTEILVSKYTQMEEQGLLDFNIRSLHCTPPYTDDLPSGDYTGGRITLKDIWFRGMAQIFVSASPAMHEEYDLHYMRPFMERCGLSYYGCCEPLDRVIPSLKKVKNLRKIGVSPWADVRSCAEQIGSDYVVARKPNPALASGNFDATDAIRKEITETIEACLENNCPYEFVLKDISTVSHNPQNLFQWVRTATEVIDRYYR
jgi:hypothetical protein